MRSCVFATARVGTLVGFVVLAACSASIPADESQNRATQGNSQGTFGSSSGASSSGAAAAPCIPDPKNAEIPDNQCDDDGDGKVDNVPGCDTGLSAGGDGEAFAKAMGLCNKPDGANKDYGLVSATFTKGYGSASAGNAAQHGILPKFGSAVKPREGGTLGILSTGYAREFDDAAGASTSFKVGSVKGGGAGAVPPGYPKAAEGCRQAKTTYDVIDLKLTIKAPQNATGFMFDFDFYSAEWPDFLCSEYNDGFVAYLNAKGFNNGAPENISFDAKKNPVSVNNGFFDRCTPNVQTGCMGDKTTTSVCPGGPGELAGTGFGITDTFCGSASSVSGGATGWLTSSAPVQPGETFTLEFLIWNTGDSNLDSSVLLDHFRWIGGAPVQVGTTRPDQVK